MRHRIVDEYYLDITHFCLFTRLKQGYCTSFYFLLQRKCFCHIALHHWFEGMFSTKSSRLFLVPFTRAFPILHPWHHIHAPRHSFPVIELVPQWLLSRIGCTALCWEQGVPWSMQYTQSKFPSVQRRGGSDTQTEARLQTVTGTISTDHSVQLVGWEVFHGIFKKHHFTWLGFLFHSVTQDVLYQVLSHSPGISYHRQTYFLTNHSHAQSVTLFAFIPRVANTSNHDTSPVITSYIVYFFVVV